MTSNLAKHMSAIKEAELYEPLNSEGSLEIADSGLEQSRRSRKRALGGPLVIFIATATAFAALGFAIGLHVKSLKITMSREDILPPSGDRAFDMRYNRTFSSAPSPETNKAWDDLFPTMKGFVKIPPNPLSLRHEPTADQDHKHTDSTSSEPPTLGLALFHELHCLNILRIGFYSALSGNISALTDEHSPHHVHDHNKRPDDHHLRHCFDYLRQSLMCLADTNLEVIDTELGGTTGWGQKQCRNFGFEDVRAVGDKFGGWDAEALELAVVG